MYWSTRLFVRLLRMQKRNRSQNRKRMFKNREGRSDCGHFAPMFRSSRRTIQCEVYRNTGRASAPNAQYELRPTQNFDAAIIFASAVRAASVPKVQDVVS